MKKIGMILIIGGLIIMSIPFIGDTYMQAKRNEMYTEYLQQLEQIGRASCRERVYGLV